MKRKKGSLRVFSPYSGNSTSIETHKSRERYKEEFAEVSDIKGLQLVILLALAAIGCVSVLLAELIH